ncbi:Ty3/gypsy retrotransposon protein [Trifolium pratense]|uniref:Ty3/gypsy retrotransposon protein n=1 Tax=Trifolium pratense TaxID=57577 RepID=A0A2K3PQ22_TRIPR|nr:Ty3/gypsy retrotransposon protein [Trifolium pratense]
MASPPSISDLAASINTLLQSQQTFQSQVSTSITALATDVNNLRARMGPPGFPPPHPDPPPIHTTSIKLDIPRFDGTDPLGWIFKITQFFDYHLTPEEQRLRIASFYMEGAALTWFQWMHQNGQLLTWANFLHALEIRFAPSQYEDPKGTLFKLTQTTTVKEYQAQFESLANRITGLPPACYLSCFISGLKPAIRREVLAFQPVTLIQAISLAKLQEEKHLDRIPSLSRPSPSATGSSSSFKPTMTIIPPKPQPVVKRLSPDELQARREKGLCYNCDETYQRGHRCKRSFHILIVEPDDVVEDASSFQLDGTQVELEPVVDPTVQTTDPDPDPAQISLHALMGHTIPQTLRVMGQIHNSPVAILIDSGSTHNFLQDRVARQLGLKTEQAHSFRVLVGNGEELQCTAMCPQTKLLLGSHLFTVDLFVLPISGAELVLGVQWLKTLGPVITDYEKLTMSFYKEGQQIQLTGVPKASPAEANIHQLQRLLATDAIDTFLHLQLIQPEPPHNPPSHSDPRVEQLLQQFASLFNSPTHLPPQRPVDHKIPLLPNTNPINVRPYRYPHFQKREIESQIKDMLANGLIQPSSSAFSSPVLLVRKKDGTWRFCVDYRALNTLTSKDRFPIPAIDELLDELYGTQWFSKLDLRSGYHQIRMAQEDIHKTAFRTHHGHYEFLVMPFGLCNAPSTFQSTMNLIFEPYLRRFVIVFFDDILVYSPTLDSHLEHLKVVFQCLLTHEFCLKQSKCSFAQSSIDYLGHIVSAEGVGPDPTKIEAMVSWPVPSNVKQLRGFLGLTGFYRKFICKYASIAAPLTALLKRDAFIWTDAAQQAFDMLKRAMSEAPVLSLPNFEDQFILETDASGMGMGAVLIQKGHPICYFSKQFCPRMLVASTYVRELCAITTAVKKWRTYLLGNTFIIYTDQRSLRELMTQVIQTPEQQFYLAKLLGYSYEIMYKPGPQNRVADALSRVHCLAITVPHLDFLHTLKEQLVQDDEFQQLLTNVKENPDAHMGFEILDDLLFFKGKLFIPSNSPLKVTLLEEFHSSTIGGHSGIHRTFGRLQENVFWHGMRNDVTQFVKSCAICQQTKPPTHSPYGLLQPLPIPDKVWEDISLDFVVGLPSFQTHTVVLVVVDRLSKAAHFGLLPTHFTAAKVADLFAKMVCKLHGMPRSIVSDRDPIFLSHFWQELFRLSGTKLRMSTAYHPQSDGQTENVNKVLQQYLRCFVHDKPKQWGHYLHWAEWHYNTAIHTSTGISPYEVVYGRPPPTLADYVPGSSKLQAVDATLTERDIVIEVLKNKLLKAQNTMKEYADLKRIPHQFKVGDWVFVKLRPYRQNSVLGRRFHKLSKRFYGPFKLVRAIGEVAFELELPDTSRIHPVFHVSQLKPCFDNTVVPLALPPETVDNQPCITPIAILDWRTNEENGQQEALVQWEGLFPEDATWENYQDLKNSYPTFDHEDMVSLDEQRDVMNQNDMGLDEEIQENWAQENEEEVLGHQPKVKRKIVRPKHLDDFVIPTLKKGGRK